MKNFLQFSKNVLVAEKSQCKALLISRHLEISLLLLMSAENTIIHRHIKLFFSYLWSFICKFISFEEIRIQANEERTPTHCLIIIIDLRLGLFVVRCMRPK